LLVYSSSLEPIPFYCSAKYTDVHANITSYDRIYCKPIARFSYNSYYSIFQVVSFVQDRDGRL